MTGAAGKVLQVSLVSIGTVLVNIGIHPGVALWVTGYGGRFTRLYQTASQVGSATPVRHTVPWACHRLGPTRSVVSPLPPGQAWAVHNSFDLRFPDT